LNRQGHSQVIQGWDSVLNQPNEYNIKEFFPYYPNEIKSGIGKASTFALRYLLAIDFGKL
jgi:hypothetical protein